MLEIRAGPNTSIQKYIYISYLRKNFKYKILILISKSSEKAFSDKAGTCGTTCV